MVYGNRFRLLASSERGEWKCLWIHGDGLQQATSLGEELITQMLFAAIIPFTGLIDLGLNGLVVGQLHLRLLEAKWDMNCSSLISVSGSRSISASR